MATKFKNIAPENLPPLFASYYEKLNLVNLPDGNYKPSNEFNSIEQQKIYENELSVPVSVLEKYAGIYKNGIITLEVTTKDNRLVYRRLYSNGYLSAVTEQKFISSNIKHIELEFFANESGEFDLCVFKKGELTWFGYKDINKEVNKVTTN